MSRLGIVPLNGMAYYNGGEVHICHPDAVVTSHLVIPPR